MRSHERVFSGWSVYVHRSTSPEHRFFTKMIARLGLFIFFLLTSNASSSLRDSRQIRRREGKPRSVLFKDRRLREPPTAILVVARNLETTAKCTIILFLFLCVLFDRKVHCHAITDGITRLNSLKSQGSNRLPGRPE